jgi:hypothetical protein
MNTIFKFALVACLSSMLTGCFGVGDLEPYYQSPLSAADQARLMAVNDTLIVPGVRVGTVFLGATDKQLYDKMGNSIESHRKDVNTTMVYTFQNVIADVNLWKHVVIRAHAISPIYATADGIKVGTPEADAKAKLGASVYDEATFDCNSGKYCTDDQQASKSICYDSGLIVVTVRAVVSMLSVVDPGSCKKP